MNSRGSDANPAVDNSPEQHCIGNAGDSRAFARHTKRPSALILPNLNCALVKFHLSAAAGNVVTGLGPGWIRIGAVECRQNVVLSSDAIATGWAASGFDGLSDDDFAQLLARKPEVVLFGTGATIRFPHPRLTRPLTEAGVGVEVMDTPAACRTFNILAAEGRSVVAALLLE